MNKHISQFLSLRCAGDVLNNVLPMNNTTKEITEAMAIVQRMKPLCLSTPMHYRLLDLCAGNALGSILAVYLLPITWAVAIDKKPVERKREAKRFTYLEANINELTDIDFMWWNIPPTSTKEIIIMSIHCCSKLALRIIELYKTIEWAKHLYLMPCCVGQVSQRKIPAVFNSRFTPYERWAWELTEMVQGKLHFDKNCLSPANAIIEAHK